MPRRASLAAQRALIAEPWGEAGPLRVRMGVHCGEAEQRGGDFFGTTVNRTARIMAAGHGGQVLLSASAGALAAEQLPAGAGLLDLGEHHLRDLGRPEHLFQLVHPDLPSRFPPLVTARSAGTDLPSRVAALIGRRDEIAQITDRLAEGSVRLLTLTGPGGTGKTTLAIRVARDLASGFRDGVSFVDLSAARDTNAALVAIARGVGLGEILDRDLEDELTDHLRDRRMLIVLDNLEQVTEAAGVVAGLLSDCPGLTVLATSREALHVRAEQVFAVPPLSLPPPGRGQETAQAIGDVRGRAAVRRPRPRRPTRSSSSPTTTPRPSRRSAAGSTGCRWRSSSRPPASGCSRPTCFATGSTTGSASCAAAPGTSPSGSRRCARRSTGATSSSSPASSACSSCWRCSRTPRCGAIEAVAEDVGAVDGVDVDVLDGLSGLVEKSLLRRVDEPGGEPRVAMLQTIRAFAVDRLDQRPDVASRTRRAHATHYADLAKPASSGPRRVRARGRAARAGRGRREPADRVVLLDRGGRPGAAGHAGEGAPHPRRRPRLVPRHGRAGVGHARGRRRGPHVARADQPGDRAPDDARPGADGHAGPHAGGRGRPRAAHSTCSSAAPTSGCSSPCCGASRACTCSARSSTSRRRSARRSSPSASRRATRPC